MWKTLPIQTATDRGGYEGTNMVEYIEYKRDPEVVISTWKDTPTNIREWCQSIWKDVFSTKVDPLNEADLVGWIPKKGTITAKFGNWIGETRSRKVVYINYLFVDPHFRGENLASKLILSICNEATLRYGNNIPFMFEVDIIPKSLTDRGAQPICRYHYTWIPFTLFGNWKQTEIDISKEKGFHGFYSGWRMFKNNKGDKIVFDSNDDIVWYSNILELPTFDGFLIAGAYCRIFSPFGTSAVFAENMYFNPSYMTHYVLG